MACVPPAVLRFIGQTLGMMARRQPIVLMPQKQELSTVEVANFLNVSRPFVIKEIEAGRLKHRKVGSHRRVLYEDLLAYARDMRAEQETALERMADNARELGPTTTPLADRWSKYRRLVLFAPLLPGCRARPGQHPKLSAGPKAAPH